MARDLANEIEKLLKATNSYIRKKVGMVSGQMTDILRTDSPSQPTLPSPPPITRRCCARCA